MTERCKTGERLKERLNKLLLRPGWISDDDVRQTDAANQAWDKHLLKCEQCREAESEAK